MVPAPGTLIQHGDLLHLVGRPEDLHNAQLVIGNVPGAGTINSSSRFNREQIILSLLSIGTS
jgi:putative transport protein